MAPTRNAWFRLPGPAAAVTAALMLFTAPAAFLSIRASAENGASDSGIRFYFALPFIAAMDREPARMGLQLMTEIGDGAVYSPLSPQPDLRPAVDLGFSTGGLAKFDVNGADMRGAYDAFARAIGLTPDEIELCRESDCLDWVKTGDVWAPPAGSGRD